jgi:hypothetical protein
MEKQNEQLHRSAWACPMSYGIKTITGHDHDPQSRCNPLDAFDATGVVVAMRPSREGSCDHSHSKDFRSDYVLYAFFAVK